MCRCVVRRIGCLFDENGGLGLGEGVLVALLLVGGVELTRFIQREKYIFHSHTCTSILMVPSNGIMHVCNIRILPFKPL